jgi:hypothetical protein
VSHKRAKGAKLLIEPVLTGDESARAPLKGREELENGSKMKAPDIYRHIDFFPGQVFQALQNNL